MESNGGRRQPIDIDEFDAALKAKGAKRECPMCASRERGTLEDLTSVPKAGKLGHISAELEGFETYGVVCSNCGFVRLHAARVFHENG